MKSKLDALHAKAVLAVKISLIRDTDTVVIVFCIGGRPGPDGQYVRVS